MTQPGPAAGGSVPDPFPSAGPERDASRHRRVLLAELQRGTVWFVRLRWGVPPGIAAVAGLARAFGAGLEILSILAVAGLVLVYNAALHLARPVCGSASRGDARYVRRFTICQVALDYGAMFLLIHLTGGVSSPLVFLFVFHIIFASILLRASIACGFAALATIGTAALAWAEFQGWIGHHPIVFHGGSPRLALLPFHAVAQVVTFGITAFLAAISTSIVARMLRTRILALADAGAEARALNGRLQALFTTLQAIGARQKLEQVLDVAKTELARVLSVEGISVKLVDPDGRSLRYAAVHGLPEEMAPGQRIDVERSPLNRRILEGEPFVAGGRPALESFQFGRSLVSAGFRSVLLVPLRVEGRVVGVLAAYSRQADRFGREEVGFFERAADLAAIAVENARAYEAIERLAKDRSHFMWRVTHNLRAPLTAVIGMLEVLRGDYLGSWNAAQAEYLRRIDRRARTMAAMVNELLMLARSRTDGPRQRVVPVEVSFLAGRIRRTFEDVARKKRLELDVDAEADVPPIAGDPDRLENLLENLVSNAIKYTPEGRVSVRFETGPSRSVAIRVEDTGIGIPEEDFPKLFSEFFRAENARAIEEAGTGLGLALVRETAEQLGGTTEAAARPGGGTVFTVRLPAAAREEASDDAGAGTRSE